MGKVHSGARSGLRRVGRDSLLALTIASLILHPGVVRANPQGGVVVSGQAEFSGPAESLTVTNAPGTIIEWQAFSIAQHEITRFVQENAQSAVLNRVVGESLSEVLGRLESNGQVFLINPNGIVVGNDAVIDTAGFVASTLGMSDADFLSGRMAFESDADAGATAGAVRNGGVILAREGSVIIVAPVIENSGLVRADNGDLILAAGRKVLVTDASLAGVTFEVQAPLDRVLNLGRLIARGGSIAAFGGTLGSSGTIDADSVSVGAGGEIILGAHGDITLEAGSVTTASGAAGGNIFIESIGTSLIGGAVRAEGTAGTGGTVDVLGAQVGVIGSGVLSADGAAGGGAIHLGGNYLGQGPLPNARAAYVGADARVSASATGTGRGGEVIVWSDELTKVYGAITARGANDRGGFVETSSARVLDVRRSVDVSGTSALGDALGGTWLLDPLNLTIVAGGGQSNVINVSDFFQPTGSPATLGVDVITAAMTGGVTITLDTNVPGGELGNITLATPFDIDATTGTNTLRFQAAGDILVNAPIFDSTPGGQVFAVDFQPGTGFATRVGASITGLGARSDFRDTTIVVADATIGGPDVGIFRLEVPGGVTADLIGQFGIGDLIVGTGGVARITTGPGASGVTGLLRVDAGGLVIVNGVLSTMLASPSSLLIDGSLQANGDLFIGSAVVSTTGAISVGGTLVVENSLSLDGTLQVVDDLFVVGSGVVGTTGAIDVGGLASFQSSLALDGSLQVVGDVLLEAGSVVGTTGAVSVGNFLVVTSGLTIGGTVSTTNLGTASSGVVNVASGARLDINGFGDIDVLFLAGTLGGAGTSNVNLQLDIGDGEGSGARLEGGHVLINQSGAANIRLDGLTFVGGSQLRNANLLTLNNGALVDGDGVLQNFNTLEVSGSSGTAVQARFEQTASAFTNLDSNAVLTLGGGGDLAGSFQPADGGVPGTVELAGGAFVARDGLSVLVGADTSTGLRVLPGALLDVVSDAFVDVNALDIVGGTVNLGVSPSSPAFLRLHGQSRFLDGAITSLTGVCCALAEIQTVGAATFDLLPGGAKTISSTSPGILLLGRVNIFDDITLTGGTKLVLVGPDVHIGQVTFTGGNELALQDVVVDESATGAVFDVFTTVNSTRDGAGMRSGSVSFFGPTTFLRGGLFVHSRVLNFATMLLGGGAVYEFFDTDGFLGVEEGVQILGGDVILGAGSQIALMDFAGSHGISAALSMDIGTGLTGPGSLDVSTLTLTGASVSADVLVSGLVTALGAGNLIASNQFSALNMDVLGSLTTSGMLDVSSLQIASGGSLTSTFVGGVGVRADTLNVEGLLQVQDVLELGFGVVGTSGAVAVGGLTVVTSDLSIGGTVTTTNLDTVGMGGVSVASGGRLDINGIGNFDVLFLSGTLGGAGTSNVNLQLEIGDGEGAGGSLIGGQLLVNQSTAANIRSDGLTFADNSTLRNTGTLAITEGANLQGAGTYNNVGTTNIFNVGPDVVVFGSSFVNTGLLALDANVSVLFQGGGTLAGAIQPLSGGLDNILVDFTAGNFNVVSGFRALSNSTTATSRARLSGTALLDLEDHAGTDYVASVFRNFEIDGGRLAVGSGALALISGSGFWRSGTLTSRHTDGDLRPILSGAGGAGSSLQVVAGGTKRFDAVENLVVTGNATFLADVVLENSSIVILGNNNVHIGNVTFTDIDADAGESSTLVISTSAFGGTVIDPSAGVTFDVDVFVSQGRDPVTGVRQSSFRFDAPVSFLRNVSLSSGPLINFSADITFGPGSFNIFSIDSLVDPLANPLGESVELRGDTLSANVILGAGATIDLRGTASIHRVTSLLLDAGASLTGPGGVDTNDFELLVGGNTLTAAIIQASDSAILRGAAPTTIGSGTVMQLDTVNVQAGANLIINGQVEALNDANFTSANLSGTGTFRANTLVSVFADANPLALDGLTFTSLGNGGFANNLTLSNGAVLNLNGNSNISTVVSLGSGAARVVNTGVLNVDVGNAVFNGVALDNSGEVNVFLGRRIVLNGGGIATGGAFNLVGTDDSGTVQVTSNYIFDGATVVDFDTVSRPRVLVTTGGVLDVRGGTSINALELSGGGAIQLMDAATLTVTDQFSWFDGVVRNPTPGTTGTGQLLVTGPLLDLNLSGSRLLSGVTLAAGTSTAATIAGNLGFADGAVLRIDSNAAANILDGVSFVDLGGAPSRLEVNGLLRSASSIADSQIEVAVLVNGELRLELGDLILRGGADLRSSVLVELGTRLTLAGGNVVLADGTSLFGRGDVLLDGAVLAVAPGALAGIDVLGGLDVQSGSADIDGTLRVAEQVVQLGGTLGGDGAIRLLGGYDFGGGNLSGSGQLTVRGGDLRILGTGEKQINGGYALVYDPTPGLDWRLSNVVFDDGGGVFGRFHFDDAGNVVTDWSLSTFGGNLEDFPATVYANGAAGRNAFVNAGPQQFLFDQPSFVFPNPRQLRMRPVTALADVEGTIPIDLTGAQGFEECFNCAPFRTMVSGELIGTRSSAVWQDGTIRVSGGGRLDINAGVLDVQTPGGVNLATGAGGGFLRIGGTGEVNFLGAGTRSIDAALDNGGALFVETGTLLLSGGGNSAGVTGAAVGGQLQLSTVGSLLTLLTGAQVGADSGGSTRVGPGTVRVAAGQTASVLFDGIFIDGRLEVLAGGLLDVRSDMGLPGNLDIVDGAQLAGAGQVIVQPGSTLQVSGNVLLDDVDLENRGVATLAGVTQVANGARLINQGSLSVASLARIQGVGPDSLINTGTGALDVGAGATLLVESGFVSNGAITIGSAGMLQLQGGGLLGGSIANGSGAGVTGVRVSGGVLTLADLLSVTGSGTTRFDAPLARVAPGAVASIDNLLFAGGRIEFIDGGALQVNGEWLSGTFADVGGGTARVLVDGPFAGRAGGPLNLERVDLRVQGGGDFVLEDALVQGPAGMEGRVTVTGGGRLTRAGTGTGGVRTFLAVQPGGVLDVNTSPFSVSGGDIAGSVTTSAGGALLAGAAGVPDPLRFLAGSSITGTGGLQIAGRSVQVADGHTLALPFLRLLSGGVQGVSGFNGSMAISNNLEWLGGGFAGSGTATVAGATTIDGAAPKLLDGFTLDISGGQWIAGDLNLIAGARLTSAAGVLTVATPDGTRLQSSDGTGGVVFSGTSRFDFSPLAATDSLRVSANLSAVDLRIAGVLETSATLLADALNLAAATVRGVGSGSLTANSLLSPAGFTLDGIDVVSGSGRLLGDVTLANGSALSFTGLLDSGSGGSTSIRVLDAGGGTNLLALSPSATLTINSASWTIGTRFANAGAVALARADLILTGPAQLGGSYALATVAGTGSNIFLRGGAATFAPTSTTMSAESALVLESGDLAFEGTFTLPRFTMTSGRLLLDSSSTPTIGGAMDWRAGTIQRAAGSATTPQLTIGPAATLTIGTAGAKTIDGATLALAGAGTLADAEVRLANDALLAVLSGGAFSLTGARAAVLDAVGSTGIVVNTGTFTNLAADGQVNTLANSGTLRVSAGTLTMTPSGAGAVASGTFDLVGGNLVLHGDLAAPYLFQIGSMVSGDGVLVLDGNGDLRIDAGHTLSLNRVRLASGTVTHLGGAGQVLAQVLEVGGPAMVSGTDITATDLRVLAGGSLVSDRDLLATSVDLAGDLSARGLLVSGATTVGSATLTLDALSLASLELSPAARLVLRAGSGLHDITDTAVLDGVVDVGAGQLLRIAGTGRGTNVLTGAGRIEIDNAGFLLDDGMRIEGTGDRRFSNATLAASTTPVTIAAGSVLVLDGTLSGTGQLRVLGSLGTEGTVAVGGTTTVTAGGLLQVASDTSSSASFASLLNAGTLNLGSDVDAALDARLTVGALTNTGTLVAVTGSGVRSVSGLTTNSGQLVADGSTLQLLGSATIANTGSLTALAGGDFLLPTATRFEHDGVLLLSTGSVFSLPAGTFLYLGGSVSGGSLEALAFSNVGGGSFGSFLSTGALNVASGTSFGLADAAVASVVNDGTLTVSGTLTTTGGVTNNGMLAGSGLILGALTNTSMLDVTSGLTIDALGGVVRNDGAIVVGGGQTLAVTNGDVANTGSISLGAGARFDADGDFDWTGGALNGGVFNVAGNLTVGGTGTSTLTSTLVANDVTILAGLDGGGNLDAAGDVTVAASTTLGNLSAGGALAVTAGTFSAGNVSAASALFEGGSTASLESLITSGAVTVDDAATRLTLAGFQATALNLLGGSQTAFSGTANLGAGGITLDGGGRLDLAGAMITGGLDIIDGTLTGTGTIDGNVVNGGIVSIGNSPGVLVIDGDFTQSADGLLVIEIGGPGAFVPGETYDQLVVNGSANLAGTLQFVQLEGFESFAQVGVLMPLTYRALAGEFTTVESVGDADFDPQIVFGPTGATASAVIAPPGDPEENAGDVAQDVAELADQQEELENCGVPEDEAPPETKVDDGHGVGCRGG